jgi:hypothetical protein
MTDFTDMDVVEQFRNFLSWGAKPNHPLLLEPEERNVPPAWWAYALGQTRYCPPAGVL